MKLKDDAWRHTLGKSTLWLGTESREDAPATPLLSHENISNYDIFLMTSHSFMEPYVSLEKKLSVATQKFQWDMATLIKFSEAVSNKLNEILDVCKAGASIIVFLGKQYDSVYPSHGDAFRLHTLPIANFCIVKPLAGSSVKVAQGAPNTMAVFSDLRFAYKVSLADTRLVPLLITPAKLKHKESVVAGYVRPFSRGGVILFCPEYALVEPRATYSVNHDWTVAFRAWVETAIELSKQSAKPALPSWADRVELRGGYEARRELREQKRVVDQALTRIDKLRNSLTKNEWEKHLFTENDDALVSAVQKVLEQLGCRVKPGPPPRSDLLACFDGTIICVEVKGHDGATKEKALIQCAKWLADVELAFTTPETDWDDTTRGCADILRGFGFNVPLKEGEPLPCKLKALIVSNTFRKTPLESRPDLKSRMAEHFPDTLQTRMVAKDVVGITGIQLLGLYDHATKESKSAQMAFVTLLATKGVSDIHRDWRKFLFEVEPSGEDGDGKLKNN